MVEVGSGRGTFIRCENSAKPLESPHKTVKLHHTHTRTRVHPPTVSPGLEQQNIQATYFRHLCMPYMMCSDSSLLATSAGRATNHPFLTGRAVLLTRARREYVREEQAARSPRLGLRVRTNFSFCSCEHAFPNLGNAAAGTDPGGPATVALLK